MSTLSTPRKISVDARALAFSTVSALPIRVDGQCQILNLTSFVHASLEYVRLALMRRKHVSMLRAGRLSEFK